MPYYYVFGLYKIAVVVLKVVAPEFGGGDVPIATR
jgi:hypothetical protein